MNVEYRFPLALPVNEAWPALLDMKRVVPCLPGASIESGEGDEFVGRIKIKLGPIDMTYRGLVRMTKRDDVAHEAILNASAKELKGAGGVSATITLRAMAVESGSEVVVLSDFTVSGKAAQFGGSVISDVGSKLMGEFADRLATQLAVQRIVGPITSEEPRESSTGRGNVLENALLSGDVRSVNSAAEREDSEALDLLGLAWWPIVKRRLIPVAVFVALLVTVWVYVRSRHS